MWCPEGYVTLQSLATLFDELGDRYADMRNLDYGEPVGPDSPEFLPEEFWPDFWQLHEMITSASEARLINTEVNFFHVWMVATFLCRVRPRLSSTTGTIMLASDALFEHALRLEIYDWGVRGSNLGLRHYITKFAFNSFDRLPLDGFTAFSYPSGIITPPENAGRKDDDISILRRTFAGWAICFKESEVPRDVGELSDMLKLQMVDENSVAGEDRLRHIFDCVKQAFPHGKTGTWELVEDRTGYSRRSINRALAVYDKDGRWAKAGQ